MCSSDLICIPYARRTLVSTNRNITMTCQFYGHAELDYLCKNMYVLYSYCGPVVYQYVKLVIAIRAEMKTVDKRSFPHFFRLQTKAKHSFSVLE